jgi:hypothetical protein
MKKSSKTAHTAPGVRIVRIQHGHTLVPGKLYWNTDAQVFSVYLRSEPWKSSLGCNIYYFLESDGVVRTWGYYEHELSSVFKLVVCS